MCAQVREAQLAQYNYILVLGEEEKRNGTVNVRTRDNQVGVRWCMHGYGDACMAAARLPAIAMASPLRCASAVGQGRTTAR